MVAMLSFVVCLGHVDGVVDDGDGHNSDGVVLFTIGGRKTNSRLIYTVFIIKSTAFHARPW